MPLMFVHLSDIHFGQERGGRVFVHDDVRDRLIDDIGVVLGELTQPTVTGVIVTGDIAYSGKTDEYREAGKWLDRLARAAGCAITKIQVVPGNHDVHRADICKASEWMLERISAEGEVTLDAFLEHELDREVLYGRLQKYREFAEAYDCPLDRAGGMAGERTFELAPDKRLRFVGLNSALCCSKNDAPGKLLLGAKQRVLPRNPGEELVVLCHHPLPWFRDSDDARRYIRSRARVFMSGHEHTPGLKVDPIEKGCDLFTLEAGATVPPVENEHFTFTYNILEFDWDPQSDGLKVIVHPRIWSDNSTRFEANTALPGADRPFYILGCPNFRWIDKPKETDLSASATTAAPNKDAAHEIVETPVPEGKNAMSDKFQLLLLRFFRDLTGAQRSAVLIKIGALPEDWVEPLSHSMERRAIDAMKDAEKLEKLESAINDALKK